MKKVLVGRLVTDAEVLKNVERLARTARSRNSKYRTPAIMELRTIFDIRAPMDIYDSLTMIKAHYHASLAEVTIRKRGLEVGQEVNVLSNGTYRNGRIKRFSDYSRSVLVHFADGQKPTWSNYHPLSVYRRDAH